MTQYWPFSGLMRQNTLRERLIVSIDLRDRGDALKLVDRLARVVGMFKVGRALFVGGGPDFIREIRRRGAEVFLDLKFHDSPQKVLRAAVEATRLGVKMFDIHPYGSNCGSTDMMTRTRAEVARICRTRGTAPAEYPGSCDARRYEVAKFDLARSRLARPRHRNRALRRRRVARRRRHLAA